MKKFWKVFDFIEDIIAGGLLFVGVAVIFYGVFMRYVMNNAQSWVDEISQYMIIWGTLIGTSVALRNEHHIKVDMLYDHLPLKAQLYVTIFANFVGLAFGAFVTKYGYTLVTFVHRTGQRSTDVGIPLYIVYSILPVMGALLSLRFILKIYEVGKHGGKDWMAERKGRVKTSDDIVSI